MRGNAKGHSERVASRRAAGRACPTRAYVIIMRAYRCVLPFAVAFISPRFFR